MTPEQRPADVGRELKVSELKPPQIVVVRKLGGQFPGTWATMRVYKVESTLVAFWAGAIGMMFVAKRVGENLEHIADDDSGVAMEIHEYLGEP